MNRGAIAVINADYNERCARNAKKSPLSPYHYFICKRCGRMVMMLTSNHAGQCGFSSVKEMRESPDIIEHGGRRKQDG